MNKLQFSTLFVLMLIVTVWAHASERESKMKNAYVRIAIIDPKWTEHVQKLLEDNRIFAIIEGSVVYGVSVPPDKKDHAVKLLKADVSKHGYWAKFSGGLAGGALFPLPRREVAAGMFEKWQKEAAKKPGPVTYTQVKYSGLAVWVAEAHFGYGTPHKRIAVYAPAKDGSFRRCLLADSNRAGKLAVTVDAKTGMLELREKANSSIKGEVVLSCNLKTIGTTYSTGVAP